MSLITMNSAENDTKLLLSGSTSNQDIIGESSSVTNINSLKKITSSRLLSWIPKSLMKKSERNISEQDGRCYAFYEDDSKIMSPNQSKSKIPIPVASAITHRKRSEKIVPQSAIFIKDLSPQRVKSERNCSPEKVFCFSTFSSAPNLVAPIPTKDFTSSIDEVLCMIKNLQESETHLTNVVCKYISDKSVEKELLNILTSYAKLQAEAERRAHSLASEMWMQQNEVAKLHETSLHDSLQGYIKQNNQLRDELENVKRKNEELTAMCLDKTASGNLAISASDVTQELRKNNNNLRQEVKDLMRQLAESNDEFQKLQNRNQTLEQNYHSANSQILSHKAALHRIQTDHELEKAHLSHELSSNQLIIKEAFEAGDVIFDDINAFSSQLKCEIDWNKFKNKESSLPDFIRMCRSCINELGKQILNAETANSLMEKDITVLKEEIKRLEDNTCCLKQQNDHLNDQLKHYGNVDGDLKTYITKCGDLDYEIKRYQTCISKLETDLEKEKASLRISQDEMDKIKKTVIEKGEELALSNEKMQEYKSENEALRMQLHGMKQILAASGSGDVARELAATQEKMSFFQSQYYQLISEKNYLVEQLQTANLERSALSEFQNSYYEYISVQQQDLETLNTTNAKLKEQLENERTQILELRTEHNKLKEEKNVMRQIYRQLKSEINKVQTLEGEMAGINMEAKRLAIIAEYNKQLGEKLQCEVAERDVKITELQNNVHELNNAQIESTKEKVALCVELTEICNINQQLSNSLVAEQQLIENKHKQQDAAVAKLKEVEEMQKIERSALKQLLTDYNNVVAQRDNLLVLQNEYLEQISELHAATMEQARNVEIANMKFMKSEENISQMDKTLYEARKKIDQLENELKGHIAFDMQRQETIAQLKKEKDEVETSVKYLQTNIRKLHTDLDNSRRLEIEMKQNYNQEKARREDLQMSLNETKICLARTKEEQQRITNEMSNLREIYEKVVNEHAEATAQQKYLKESLEKNIDELREMLEESNIEIERLQDVIVEKDYSYNALQRVCDGLKNQLQNAEAAFEDIEDQSRLLSESNLAQSRLQESVTALKQESQEQLNIIAELKAEKNELEAKIKAHVKELETNYSKYKKHIQGIRNEYDFEKEEMHNTLHHLTSKLEELNECYANEKAAHGKLLEAHKEVAARLLKAVKMLIDEKIHRQTAENNAAKLTETNTELNQQIKVAEDTVNNLAQELNEMKLELEKAANSKAELQQACVQFKKVNKETQSSLKRSSQENVSRSIRETEIKELHSKLLVAEERARTLKMDLERSHKLNMELTAEITQLKQKLTATEFQKCEVCLRLHELEAKFNSELDMNTELTNINQKVLSEILKMAREGLITHAPADQLMDIIQGRRSGNACEVN